MEDQGCDAHTAWHRDQAVSFILYRAWAVSQCARLEASGATATCVNILLFWCGRRQLQWALNPLFCPGLPAWTLRRLEAAAQQLLFRDSPLRVLARLLLDQLGKGRAFVPGRTEAEKQDDLTLHGFFTTRINLKNSVLSRLWTSTLRLQHLCWCLLGLNGFRMGPTLCRHCNPHSGACLGSSEPVEHGKLTCRVWCRAENPRESLLIQRACLPHRR